MAKGGGSGPATLAGHRPPHQGLAEIERGHLSQNPASYLPMHTLEGDEAEETGR